MRIKPLSAESPLPLAFLPPLSLAPPPPFASFFGAMSTNIDNKLNNMLCFEFKVRFSFDDNFDSGLKKRKSFLSTMCFYHIYFR